MSDTYQQADEFLLNEATHTDPPVKVSRDKKVSYAVDNNSGSYTHGTITIDATSQMTGSSGFASIKDGYLIIPYVVSMKNTATAATGDFASTINRYCVGLKSGVWNVIDALSVELNGKTVLTDADYKLFWNNIRHQLTWSDNDVLAQGADSFFYPDDAHSMRFGATAGTAGPTAYGDGYVNNAANNIGNLSSNGADVQLAQNNGFIARLLANPSLVANCSGADGSPTVSVNSNGWRTTRSGSARDMAVAAGKGCFANTATAPTFGQIGAIWTYMLKIKLADLHPLFGALDLTMNPQLKIKLKMNAGTVDITTGASNVMSLNKVSLKGKTCPIMVSSAESSNPLNGVFQQTNAGAFQVAFGPLQNDHITYAVANNYMSFGTARLYLPFYDIANPQPIISKPIKKYTYLDVYAQYFTQRAGSAPQTSSINASFSLQLSCTLANIKAVAVVPFSDTIYSSTPSLTHFVGSSAIAEQFQSPFDSAPATCQPGSLLRNFQVAVGNENVFSSVHEYDWQNFYDEYGKLFAINGGQTHEISNGLIDYQKWSTVNRVLIADTSRLTSPDIPQSVLVSGVNASCSPTNLLVFVLHEKSISLNRLTGEVVEFN